MEMSIERLVAKHLSKLSACFITRAVKNQGISLRPAHEKRNQTTNRSTTLP